MTFNKKFQSANLAVGGAKFWRLITFYFASLCREFQIQMSGRVLMLALIVGEALFLIFLQFADDNEVAC